MGDLPPFCLLGGNNDNNGVSQESINALASIRSWMTLADNIRTNNSVNIKDILVKLDNYLKTKSFVVPSPSPTLSDLDLYLTLVSSIQKEGLEVDTHRMLHLIRWMTNCHVMVCKICELGENSDLFKYICYNTFVKSDTKDYLPRFYFGDEELCTLKTHHISYGEDTILIKNSYSSLDKNKSPRGKENVTDELRDTNNNKQNSKDAVDALNTKVSLSNKKNNGVNVNVEGGKPGFFQKGVDATSPNFDISALDIRVGKILKAWPHAESEKLYCEEVDVGEDHPRKIVSGLRLYYSESEMENRYVLVVCNLKKRNFIGFPSHGMILCASNSNTKETFVEFIIPPQGSNIGERVRFDGFEKGEPESEKKVAKKKIFETLLFHLKTNQNGTLIWKNAPGRTNSGPCFVSRVMVNSIVS